MRLTAIAVLLAIACTSAAPQSEGRATQTIEPTAPIPAPLEPAVASPPQPAAPTSDPPPPPAPPTPRFVPGKTFPSTVWAATVDTGRDEWSVDIADFVLDPEGPLAAAVQADDEMLIDLPGGLTPLPDGWNIGDAWTLVTKKGTVTRKVTSYGLSMSGGSGETFVHVRLGAAPTGAKGPAIAVRGKSNATLGVPKALRPAAIGPTTLHAIREAMIAGFDDESKPLMRRAKLRENNVAIYPGRFPGDRTHVAFATLTTGADGEETTLSAMLFVRTGGKIEFFRQADVLGEMTFVALGDLDGDARDEVLYEDAYHEGWYVELVYWPRGKPKVRVLTGDGV